MKFSYKFFENRDCRYYPCHEGLTEINCLFCFCPLYYMEDCGGDFTISKAGRKDCSHCVYPHPPERYQEIMERLKSAQGGKAGVPANKGSGRKGILAVSFGTSHKETLVKTIGGVEKRLSDQFPEYEVRRAFTSTVIRGIWEKRGVSVDDVSRALERMVEEGFAEVYVQPLLLLPGEEYHKKIISGVSGYRDAFPRFAVGLPLLAEPHEYGEIINAIRPELPQTGPKEAVVFMGHGTRHFSQTAYVFLQEMIKRENLPVYIGTLEEYPGVEEVVSRLKGDGVEKAYLLPLMLVAGDHALHDMAGDREDSWASVLAAHGVEAVPVLKGLGEFPGIQEFFIRKTASGLKELGGVNEGQKGVP